MKDTNCLYCKHYFITWDKIQPHGCKAFQFKSREIPQAVVERNSSGKSCQMFSRKPAVSRNN